MTQLVAWTLLGAFGLLVLARGALPPRPTLDQRLSSAQATDRQLDTSLKSGWARLGLFTIRLVQRDKLEHTFAKDLAASRIELEDFARDKLNAAVGGAIVVTIAGMLLGWLNGPRQIILVSLVGLILGFVLPDIELAKKAKESRVEFSESLTAFVSLAAVCLSGGGGINSAISDALGVGGGWPFEVLRTRLNEASVAGESFWSAFDRLGHEIGSEDLIELAGALGLAGTSGARITDSLRARAESSRSKERQQVLADAQRASERLSFPIAILALSWMAFVGYAAIWQLVAS